MSQQSLVSDVRATHVHDAHETNPPPHYSMVDVLTLGSLDANVERRRADPSDVPFFNDRSSTLPDGSI